mmetsp:Transcript_21159/g.38308  ORF Transcript_21159/g.38308 Transcript_21159/m.38308 type:complete len:283 (+) Transcript_21159:1142-1990(+)
MFQGLADGNEILERLGHFKTLNVQMPRVGKVIHPLLATKACLRLSQFIIMMRKLEIFPTRVNINPFPQNISCNDRAFNMPSWTARSKGRIPGWFPSLARLPQCKVIGVAFFARLATAQGTLALCHLRRRGRFSPWPCRIQLTIVMTRRLECVQTKIHRSIALVRQTFSNNLLHKGDDLRYILGNTCQHIWLTNAKSSHILHKLPLIPSCMRIEYRMISHQMALFSIQLLGKDRFGRLQKIGTCILLIGRCTACLQGILLVLIQILSLDQMIFQQTLLLRPCS